MRRTNHILSPPPLPAGDREAVGGGATGSEKAAPPSAPAGHLPRERGRNIEGGFALYVHWPFCLAKCPYCDFNSHVRAQVDGAGWRDALVCEMKTLAERLETRPVLSTVFFGGGTPSLMPPETVAALLDAAAALFPQADNLEVTLEANPTSSEAARFKGFRAAGVNRLSLGVQSLKDDALKFLGRKHTAEEALATLDLARNAFPRVSFDLIYGRPGQSVGEWAAELECAIALAADHLSLYQLTIEPGTKFGTLAKAGHVLTADDETAAELYDLTRDVTEAAGLPAYEVSNHARPGAESRHNLVYWRGGAWLGVGPGAHGRLPTMQGGRIATDTEKIPERWLASVETRGHGLVLEAPVPAHDQAKELLLMSLRLAEGTDISRVGALSPDLLDDHVINALASDGFLARIGERLYATRKGRPVLNRLIAEIVRD